MCSACPRFVAILTILGSFTVTAGLTYNLVDHSVKGLTVERMYTAYIITILALLSFFVNICMACGEKGKVILYLHYFLLIITSIVDIVTIIWDIAYKVKDNVIRKSDFGINREFQKFPLEHVFLPKYASDFFPCLIQAIWMFISLLITCLAEESEKHSKGHVLHAC